MIKVKDLETVEWKGLPVGLMVCGVRGQQEDCMNMYENMCHISCSCRKTIFDTVKMEKFQFVRCLSILQVFKLWSELRCFSSSTSDFFSFRSFLFNISTINIVFVSGGIRSVSIHPAVSLSVCPALDIFMQTVRRLSVLKTVIKHTNIEIRLHRVGKTTFCA